MEGNREPGPRGVVEKPHSCHGVKGLPALVESSPRRFFAEFTLSAEILRLRLRMTAGSEGLRMTEGGFLNSPPTLSCLGALGGAMSDLERTP
jgi:hypothetical protein